MQEPPPNSGLEVSGGLGSRESHGIRIDGKLRMWLNPFEPLLKPEQQYHTVESESHVQVQVLTDHMLRRQLLYTLGTLNAISLDPPKSHLRI